MTSPDKHPFVLDPRDSNRHLFVLDARHSRDASVAADELVLMCTCGLPEANDRHYHGLEGVEILIQKKEQEAQIIADALCALYALQAKLQIREWEPLARYVAVNWIQGYDRGRTFETCSMGAIWSSDGTMLSEDCDDPGNMYTLCERMLGVDATSDDSSYTFDLETGKFVIDEAEVALLPELGEWGTP